MDKIIRFLKGYLQIRITGQEPIRFLNLCKMRGIFLWNIDSSDQRLKACMNIQDYFLLHDILRKTGTRATVMTKNGMPFFVPKIKRKIIFLIAICLVLGYLWNMSHYIWRIEFEGNQYVTEECLLDFLKQNHVTCGTAKTDIDIEYLEFELRKSFPQITWVCLSFQETKLLVSIKENRYLTVEDKKVTSRGSNLVADKDGTIISIVTRKGIPCVKPGDTVQKGDILVEGSVPVYDEAGEVCNYQVYDADATIIARTAEQYRYDIDNMYDEKVYTGRKRIRLGLLCHGKVLKIPALPITYDSYEIITEKVQCKLFKHFYLPIYHYEECFVEYVISPRQYTSEERNKILNEDLEKIMLSFQQKGVQIIQKNVRIKETVKKTELIADFLLYERIGRAEVIPEIERQIN